MVTILSSEDVESYCSVESILPEVETALIEEAVGHIEKPTRPHFPIGDKQGSQNSGTALVMPAYIHGEEYYATKVVSVHEDNPSQNLPTVQAQISLINSQTGRPVAYMPGTQITSVRTGCVGGIATRELAADPIRLGVIGAGTQARWQTRAIAENSELVSVSVYSPSHSKHECVRDLRTNGIPANAAESASDAVSDASVIVTATTSTKPVFPPNSADADLIIAVGAYKPAMQELDPMLVEQADSIFADVPNEAVETGDFLGTPVNQDDVIPLAKAITESSNRTDMNGPILVKSVGSAVMDLTAATEVFRLASSDDTTTNIEF